MDLNVIWFLLVGVLLIGYSILDGFDLGVGILSLFVKDEKEKDEMAHAIAPFWDGNEVWLLTAGGALFAAFPHVYATVFSGFYLAMMLLLVALIFRAISIEFKHQVDAPAWKSFWNKAFSFGSLVITLLLGVALGNIFIGIPIDSQMNFTGSFFTLLRPLPLAVGITGIFMICMQGAAYLLVKTDKPLVQKATKWVKTAWILFIILAAITTVVTAITDFSKITTIFSSVFGYITVILFLAGVIALPRFLARQHYFKVFLSSSLIIVSMFLFVAVAIFPNVVPAQILEHSLNIYNASSSKLTLTIMLVVALVGMPIVIAYTTYSHRIFKK